ncbi:hypothetical protein P8452_17121 [Trifolium repens]|nr:hypothetical protein P8452_17121 [Trifolium repens]
MHFYHLFRVFEFSGIVRKFLLQNSLSLSFLSSYTNFIIILPKSREDLFLEETRRLKNSRDFIAPCKCKGTSKYVHRECLDHWRSVKVMKIADKRADIVRITFHGKKEVDACFEIKNSLVQKNYNIPLVADIHFVEITSIFSLVEITKLSICLTESIVETLVKMQVSSIHGFMCHKVVFLSVAGPQ